MLFDGLICLYLKVKFVVLFSGYGAGGPPSPQQRAWNGRCMNKHDFAKSRYFAFRFRFRHHFGLDSQYQRHRIEREFYGNDVLVDIVSVCQQRAFLRKLF